MSHRHGWPYEDPTTHKCVELGPTVCARPTVHGGDPDVTNADGTIAGGPDQHLGGFIIAHDVVGDPSAVRCEGHVTVDAHFPDKHRWSMTGSLEGGDLTLSPSVLCTIGTSGQCGFHGFVQAGKWVPA